MSTSNDQPHPLQQGEAVATNGHSPPPHPLRSNPVTTGGETTSSTGNAASESSQPTLLSAHLTPVGEEDRRELEAAWNAAATLENPPTPAPSSTDSDASNAPAHRNEATVNGAPAGQVGNRVVEATSIEDHMPRGTDEERRRLRLGDW
ncbi:hypothetical protein PMIN01_11997 [Paraphaeosphaeria minitans]|uniref:Uncharacterized protein n=1 Tax=Paraphaeosphaeria minitans TaxID=565426 RepID=A0A9P6G726_9PLEO|nr:hypothetical protein PMIN01_11997 [Paraphaeosphaeria minitans]